VLAKLRDTLRAAVGDADFKGRWRRSRLRSCSSRARSSPSFFEADAARLAEGVCKVGRIETK
jgi:hypothetical protein